MLTVQQKWMVRSKGIKNRYTEIKWDTFYERENQVDVKHKGGDLILAKESEKYF